VGAGSQWHWILLLSINFICGENSPICEIYILRKYSVTNSPFFFEKIIAKKKTKKKIRQNSPQHKRMLKIFLLSHFEYCQIWLNILVDDRHKTGKKTLLFLFT
jgi:hypothetical protein